MIITTVIETLKLLFRYNMYNNYTSNTDPLISQYFDLFTLIIMPVIQTYSQVNILTYLFDEAKYLV